MSVACKALLEQALAKSAATWKVVCHHHPPFSLDYVELKKGK